MLALIAGTGALPPALVACLPARPLICAMAGFAPALTPDVTFRIEHLGSFLANLKARGVDEVCMAGAVRRPDIDQTKIDAATLPLVPRIASAIAKGDDGALREIIGIFEEAGLAVRAAHQIAPGLLPDAGVPTKTIITDQTRDDAALAEQIIAQMGAADAGQACLVRGGHVLAREDQSGTDAMIAKFAPVDAKQAELFKAPKPTQDRRADLPVIGPDTARNAAAAGLAGIVIEAGGVMVLDQPKVLATLDAAGLFLWVRPKGGA
ncbi:LpxI family protein [Loktanella sp. Alg231-35]|uniref:LpxI family protein n=1 Tax=Loktanella sp. Alg231-35 TaxID=1922220 RepID=UPI000D54F697|nr:UDP-2,3-diacylglucosamine diphosphatase LpxI [Loktanella sp. Alg231-35]